MNGPLQTRAWDLRANDIELTLREAYLNKNDTTDLLEKEIHERAVATATQQGLTVFVGGPTGTGKSTVLQQCAIWWVEEFFGAKGVIVDDAFLQANCLMAFTDDEHAENLPKLNVPGRADIQDERPFAQGEGAVSNARQITNVNSTDRAAQIFHGYSDPKVNKLQVYDLRLFMTGKSLDEDNRVLVFVNVGEKNDCLVGHAHIPLPDREKYKGFLAAYNLKKQGFIDQTHKARGKIGSGLHASDNDSIKQLVQYGRKLPDGVKLSKNVLIAAATELGLVNTEKRAGKLATLALVEIARAGDNSGGNHSTAAPKILPAEDFADFFEANAPASDTRAIVADYLRGNSKRSIARESGINRKKVDGAIKNSKGLIGDVFEWFIAVLVGVPLDQIHDACPGHEHGVPDLVWEDKIYSIKWRDDAEQISQEWFLDECGPERDAALAASTVFYFVETNKAWGPTIRLREVDPAHTTSWTTAASDAPWATTEISTPAE